MNLFQSRRIKWPLLIITWLFMLVLLILPIVLVFTQAFAAGWRHYFSVLGDLTTLHAINLSVAATVLSVGINLVLGLSAAWAIAFYDFPGKKLLNTLIDLPLSVSPVIVGLIFILIFGRTGWLQGLHWQVIFAPPAIFIVTIFVTFPFVARELIPFLIARGREEEQTAAFLGAHFWQILRQITLPAIKAPLGTGLVLATARALGEFGAVAVVSGNIPDKTLTLPLLVQNLYNDFKFTDAFAVATILLLTTFLIITLKRILIQPQKG
ncbi:sulfate ABC transporter permease [Loigolactobacillus bifermentans]|jgi:sulfate transport system permease protein|uniref:Sulfate transport system permease protein CysW n=1 Tax=Loigolactobacillus bifermentans DSM 20003 TaxID=1423726 RepID=A0A0R1GKN5_9LACO|nr:sulfate ABC transporter permease subunit [Loigolactobacillus bifermentans]KRK34645.1 sulfate transport system permease protein CysW [Loigolactobacillus bifermentans DSM 20003]QGG61087.1 sulfate ABC transporter permease subunit [Loigolactobacillus bifermentans]